MVSRRALTRKELIFRLTRKGASAESAAQIADDFTALGYINDALVAEDFTRHGRENRLVGRILLQHEMRQKGIASELIDTTLDEAYPIGAEISAAHRFAERKLRLIRNDPPMKQIRKMADALNRRGFSGGTIEAVIRKMELQLKDLH